MSKIKLQVRANLGRILPAINSSKVGLRVIPKGLSLAPINGQVLVTTLQPTVKQLAMPNLFKINFNGASSFVVTDIDDKPQLLFGATLPGLTDKVVERSFGNVPKHIFLSGDQDVGEFFIWKNVFAPEGKVTFYGTPEQLASQKTKLEYQIGNGQGLGGSSVTLPGLLEKGKIEFIPLTPKETISLNGYQIKLLKPGVYQLIDGDHRPVVINTQTGRVSLKKVLQKISYYPLKQKSTGSEIISLGTGSGMTLSKNTSGVMINGIVIDPPHDTLYTLKALKRLGSIERLVLTHLHSDHYTKGLLQVAKYYKNTNGKQKIELYTSAEIWDGLVKIMNAEGKEASQYFKPILVTPGETHSLKSRSENLRVTFRTNIHPIPTLGVKISNGDQTVIYSGDTLHDPALIEKLTQGRERELLLNFGIEEDLKGGVRKIILFHENGVPPIHTNEEGIAFIVQDINNKIAALNLEEPVNLEVLMYHTDKGSNFKVAEERVVYRFAEGKLIKIDPLIGKPIENVSPQKRKDDGAPLRIEEEAFNYAYLEKPENFPKIVLRAALNLLSQQGVYVRASRIEVSPETSNPSRANLSVPLRDKQGKTMATIVLEVDGKLPAEKLSRLRKYLQNNLRKPFLNFTRYQAHAQKAYLDSLTRLLNGTFIKDFGDEIVFSWREQGHPVTVATADIDHFKGFNDRGMADGDDILTVIGIIAKNNFRSEDVTAARKLTGDEMVILLKTDAQGAKTALERYRLVTRLVGEDLLTDTLRINDSRLDGLNRAAKAQAVNIVNAARKEILNGIETGSFKKIKSAEEFYALVNNPRSSGKESGGKVSGLHLSIGYASLKEEWLPFKELSDASEKNLKVAKETGRDQVVGLAFAGQGIKPEFRPRRLSNREKFILAKRAAQICDITGMYRRDEFLNRLVQSFETEETRFLFFFDLDAFKAVNDTFNYPVGSSVLKITSRASEEIFTAAKPGIRKILSYVASLVFRKANALLGRYGGEEFAVAFRAKDRTEALHKAELFSETVRAVFTPLNESINAEEYSPETIKYAKEVRAWIRANLGTDELEGLTEDIFNRLCTQKRYSDRGVGGPGVSISGALTVISGKDISQANPRESLESTISLLGNFISEVKHRKKDGGKMADVEFVHPGRLAELSFAP